MARLKAGVELAKTPKRDSLAFVDLLCRDLDRVQLGDETSINNPDSGVHPERRRVPERMGADDCIPPPPPQTHCPLSGMGK